MKTFLRISFFFFLVTQICLGQWYTVDNLPEGIKVNTLHFINSNTGWIAGFNYNTGCGIILKTTDQTATYSITNVDTRIALNAIQFIDDYNGWVVGDSGTIYHTTNSGIDWIKQITGTKENLKSLCFLDSENGWVSADTNILHTANTGNNWVLKNIGYSLSSIFFISSSIGWCTRDGFYTTPTGGIMKTTDSGITWNEVYDKNTTAIYFIDANIGWAIEKGWEVFHDIGMIIKTTDGGLSWVNKLTQPGLSFNDIFFINENTGWVTGNFATILKTTDAGENWGQQISGVSESDWLYEVQFLNQDEGWVTSPYKILNTPNGGGSIVPVELTSFTAQALDQKIILRWTTATELNNNGFEIQRRVAESEFATIGFVRGEGTTTNQKQYSYIDKDLVDGKYFYRLKQIDFNGAYEYSDVIEIEM